MRQDSNAYNKTGETEVSIAWGKKVSPEFKTKVMKIAKRLQIDVNYLMASIAFETGETFDPAIKNPKSSATGLIQFLSSTAIGLGTTTDALSKMSAVEQLDYVEKYFEPYKGKLITLEDVYMAILWPQAVGKEIDYVLFSAPSPPYNRNTGLDLNKDGSITKLEASTWVRKYLNKGLEAENLG